MSFTETLWEQISPLYSSILDHAFIRQLAAGTLSPEVFKFYLQQDARYLDDFSRALAITGTKAPDSTQLLRFLEFARGAIVTERALHESYFQEFDVQPGAERSPACFSYTNFLLLTACRASYEVSVAALLPCFWIYREAGLHIHREATPDNPYARWIETYAGEEFGEAVEQAIDTTDRVGEQASTRQKAAMLEHFVISGRLEWMFWDSAYRLERWKP